MPLYDFKCPRCEDVKEVMLPLGAETDEARFGLVDPLKRFTVVCFKCGHFPMMKQPSAPSFKVGGFSAANGYSKPSGS